MSFILDALKKSEIDRQRQSVPGLIDVPAASRRRVIPVWVWAIVALLGINVAVLLVLLLRGTGSGKPAARDSAAARQTPAAAPRAPDHFSPLDSAPVYAPEIPVADGGAAARTSRDDSARDDSTRTDTARGNAAGVASGAPPAARADASLRPSRRPDPVLAEDPPDSDEMLPSLSELNLTGASSLPDIHLDVHVYATRAADRFVYINMRKYREGAVLQEGPTLERIRRDGVVLEYNGLRFFVPRQS